ncbi:hypothetical protein CPC08DRAFT_438084 [Agrocybe pediades]|nr:hypothetical protein CPC08DRAFT_438084 [Agrocybe pediades]
MKKKMAEIKKKVKACCQLRLTGAVTRELIGPRCIVENRTDTSMGVKRRVKKRERKRDKQKVRSKDHVRT